MVECRHIDGTPPLTFCGTAFAFELKKILAKMPTARQAFRDKLMVLWDHEKTIPRTHAKQRRYRGSQNQYSSNKESFQVPFAYSPGNIAELEAILSPARLARYVNLAVGDKEKALRFYAWNSALSESLYTPLQGLEVALRNALGNALLANYGALWFELNPGPALHYPLPDMLLSARTELGRRGIVAEHGRIVAELNWGFWTGLLAPRYETNLWRPYFRRAFPHAPARFVRNDVYRPLDDLRRLRNRIAHHEPILNRNIAADYADIIKLVGWISADMRDWIDSQSQVATAIAAQPV